MLLLNRISGSQRKACCPTRIVALAFCSLLACLWDFPAAADSIVPGTIAVVADDGNNLRAHGGPDYKDSKILGTLNKGVRLRVLSQEGSWSEVVVGQSERGWVNSKCLIPAAQYLSDPKNKDEVFCPGDYSRRFPADLDKEHAAAVVILEDVATLDGGGGRLVVQDSSGKTLWRGPMQEMPSGDPEKSNPLFYFCSPGGVYWPSIVGDIERDGFAEIVASDAQSDVSVSSFTIARWSGNTFAIVRSGDSLVESPLGSGRYAWQKWSNANKDVRWIMGMKKLEKDGSVLADVFESGPKLALRFGTALIRLDDSGATLLKWIKPLGTS